VIFEPLSTYIYINIILTEDTNWVTQVFRRLTPSLQANSGTVTEIWPRPLPFTYFPIPFTNYPNIRYCAVRATDSVVKRIINKYFFHIEESHHVQNSTEQETMKVYRIKINTRGCEQTAGIMKI
jgi:hypothetical protein